MSSLSRRFQAFGFGASKNGQSQGGRRPEMKTQTEAAQTYEMVIGLEVHCQLKTATKLFCSSGTDSFGAVANSRVCPICTGHPGTLPVLNRKAVELAFRAGLALGCRIKESSIFARKNYFYPDLPKGYQISQYEQPFAEA